MRYLLFSLLVCVLVHPCLSQSLAEIEKNRVQLPNGWSLTPVGKSLQLGDLPLNMALSRSGKYLAVTNNGHSIQSLQLFDVKQQKELDAITIPKSWYGLCFTADEKSLYASAGNDNMVKKYDLIKNKLVLSDSLVLGKRWPNPISPTGISVDDKANVLYVVTKDNNSLYIFDLKTKALKSQLKLPGEAYTCVLSPSKNILYISCWGCDKLLSFDTKSGTFHAPIVLGDNPNEIVLSKNEQFLFICNGNENTVSVISTEKAAVIETLNTALYADAPNGSTPNGLALSSDNKTLYIANATNNCLAVFDVSVPGQSKPKGFIPAGWYPTSVKVAGNNIWIANGKGFTSLANPNGPNPIGKKQVVEHHAADSVQPAKVQYIGGLFHGKMSIVKQPSEKQLFIYSTAVYNNTLYTKKKEITAEGMLNNPIPMSRDQKSPIKYVFYVIQENRTYDQVLGDMPEGNGDTSLVLFGEKITPNHHALAKDFVLLDNFYVDAEVSADGHNWTTGAYANDFVEKTWPSNYSGRGGVYPAEGNREIGNNKGGFIWNACKRAGVSYRSYGEFVDNGKPNIPELKGHFCPYYSGFDMKIMDSMRFHQWKRDFDSLLAINQVPQFNTVRMGNDHTEGLKKNARTPFAYVADNDYAVGMLVDYLQKSSIWNETAIFIVEDDAQNGADHVDAHRSPAYLAGGFVKRGFVDHTAYSTTSMLRTMELILGVLPMTQYDAAAVPFWRCFDTVARPSPFKLRKPNVDLGEKNVAMNEWQRRSDKFDLSKEDNVPDLEFNEVLWHAVKGDRIPFPGAKRSAFLMLKKKDADDDDDD